VNATGLDGVVARWCFNLALSNAWLRDVGAVLAFALHPWVFRVLVALGCARAWRRGRRRAAVVAATTMAVGGVLAVALKLVIQRPRPFWGDPVAQEVGFSMPSGHALNATLGSLLLLALFWPTLQRLGRTRVAAAVAALVILVTCLDRLLLGVHYLSDVAVGVAIGGALAAVAERRMPRLRGGMAAGVSRG